jgi:multiple sugar transport system substrate-binding protein
MRPFRSFLGLLLPVLLCILSGCGKGQKPIRVSVFTADPLLIKILTQTMKEIEGRHPGLKIKVENISYNDYQDKLTVQLAANNAPDVISVEASNFSDLFIRGALEDLTPYFKRDQLDPKAYYATALKRYSPGNGIYAIPSDIAPVGLLYYNKKVFDDAGVPYPNADVFMLSNGGYFMNSEEDPTRLALDTPEVLQAYQFRWDMIYKWHVSPTVSEIQNFNFGNGAEGMFMNGLVAMMCSGLWHTPNFLEKGVDFDVVEFPKGPKGKRGWGTGGTGYAIWSGCKDKEKAWEVVKELAGEDLVTKLTATGMMQPALVKVAESDAFLKSRGPDHKRILLDMPKYSHYAPFIKGWNEIWYGQVGPAMDPVWLGTKQPGEVLPKLTADINKRYFDKK